MPPPGAERPPAARGAGGLLAAGFAVLWAVYLACIPAFEAPDEQEHLAYAQALADGRWPHLPTVPEPVYVDGQVDAWRDRPTGLPAPWTYQAQHPPLAYLPYALWLKLVDALGLPLRAVRAVGLLWGLVALAGLLAIARDAPLPDAVRRLLPATVLLPAPVYLCAAVNNDGLSFALGTLLTWRLLRLLTVEPTRREALILGALLAAGLLCKLNLAVFAPFVAHRWWSAAARRRGRARALLETLALLAAAALPALLWGLHNHGLYGTLFPRAHARPTLDHAAQLWAHPDAPFLVLMQSLVVALAAPASVLPAWLLLQFGWNAHTAVVLVTAAIAVIGGVGAARAWRQPKVTPRAALDLCFGLFAMMVALVLHQFLFQDYEVGLHGARYYLPVLPAWILLLAVAYDELCSEAQKPYLPALAIALFAVLGAGLAPLASFALGAHR